MKLTTLSIPVHETAAEAYAESLKMILKHVADFHLTVVDIISEKYNIPVDEIMNTVTSDSRYTNMLVDQKIHELTRSSNILETPAPAPAPAPATAPATAKKIVKKSEKKIKIKPKNVVLLPETNASSC